MKIHIIMDFVDGPWGGGNQFLKALKGQFIKKNIYEENPNKCDIALFNSHHNIKNVIKIQSLKIYKLFYIRKII